MLQVCAHTSENARPGAEGGSCSLVVIVFFFQDTGSEKNSLNGVLTK